MTQSLFNTRFVPSCLYWGGLQQVWVPSVEHRVQGTPSAGKRPSQLSIHERLVPNIKRLSTYFPKLSPSPRADISFMLLIQAESPCPWDRQECRCLSLQAGSEGNCSLRSGVIFWIFWRFSNCCSWTIHLCWNSHWPIWNISCFTRNIPWFEAVFLTQTSLPRSGTLLDYRLCDSSCWEYFQGEYFQVL